MIGDVDNCDLPDWVAQDLTWQLTAACLGMFDDTGEDLFFPPDNPGGPKAGKGITGEKERVDKARAICSTCPVKKECLNYAIEHECQGIWGGTTDSERKKIRREMILRRGLMIWNVKIRVTTATRITLSLAVMRVTSTSIGLSALNRVTRCMIGALCVTEL
jgi:WhiB family transcriptional regulator, redox-sensing transcriptional regulator